MIGFLNVLAFIGALLVVIALIVADLMLLLIVDALIDSLNDEYSSIEHYRDKYEYIHRLLRDDSIWSHCCIRCSNIICVLHRRINKVPKKKE